MNCAGDEGRGTVFPEAGCEAGQGDCGSARQGCPVRGRGSEARQAGKGLRGSCGR